MRACELKICRRLTDFGAVHHQSQMFGFDMFTARFQTVVHGGLQANLMAIATSVYTGLHGMVGLGMLMHGIILSE
jgi:hypothetical protein